MQISDYFKDVFVGYEYGMKEKKVLEFSDDEDDKKKPKDKKDKKKPVYIPELCPGGSLIATRILDHEKKIV
jgi:hypothetical protein